MVHVLADPELYAFTGGEPPTLAQLRERYRSQVAGSPVAGERWHNWIVRLAGPEAGPGRGPEPVSGAAVGFVQATVLDGDRASVAWLVGVPWHGRGLAREAAQAMCGWLRESGVRRITAHIHPDHDASARVAAACGLQPTGEVDEDGERIWASAGE
jgi:RimJ/RimL family protein N-acetyltransferase